MRPFCLDTAAIQYVCLYSNKPNSSKTFERVSLVAKDCNAAIDLMVQHQLPGGGIFDALNAQTALKAQADVLLTLNPKHFTRLGTAIASKVQVPQ